MRVNVLLYDSGKDTEGIHSLEISGKTVVLMFENRDDAERYSLLLEAQDFPIPTIETLDRSEVESFCNEAGYEACFVQKGFVPQSDHEKLMLVPPELNKDVSNWQEDSFELTNSESYNDKSDIDSLEKIRKNLEDLL